jgi:magnesium-protoporphyrin IX monomethyl ester (oxidative) cyclase
MISRRTDLPDSIASKKIQKVMLIYPSMVFDRLQSRQTAMFPLGLGYIAGVLENEFEVTMLDSALEGYENLQHLPNGKTVYGLDERAMKSAIERFAPDAVLVSCLFSSLHHQALRVTRLVKETAEGTVTLVGGPHVSAIPHLILREPSIDYCIIGEGEDTALKLLRNLQGGKKLHGAMDGLGFRSEGKPVIIPKRHYISNLDELPFPARHRIDLNRYFSIGKIQGLRLDGKSDTPARVIQMIATRGCPNRCTYCAKSVTWGTSYRMRGVDTIVQEIKSLVDTYQVEKIAFQDDNLTVNRKHAVNLLNAMIEEKLPVTWEAHNGLEVDTLDEQLLDTMKASGCESFTVAIEFGTTEILHKAKKKVHLEKARATIRHAQRIGIDVRGFFMLGYPGETRAHIQQTCEYARSLNLSVTAFALVTPLPGTALWDTCLQEGLINGEALDFSSLSFGGLDLQLSEVPVAELLKIRKIEWLKNAFADADGNLKPNLTISRKELLSEIEKGLALYPGDNELQRLHTQATGSETRQP